MSSSGVLAVSTAAGALAIWMVVSGWRGGTPSLASTVRSIRRAPASTVDRDGFDGDVFDRVGSQIDRRSPFAVRPRTAAMLRVLGRSVDRHLGLMAVAALAGLLLPSAIAILLRFVGAIDRPVGPLVPAGVGVAAAVIVPLLVHAAAIERSAEIRLDLRHQLSAFVDVVTMLLAGNTGHEGSLRSAADAGDGRLFRVLRRRMREASTTGRSMVDALDAAAIDLDLDELAQIAATTRLAAGEGAPVAATLAAKCSTLRSTLASDTEAQARIRTDKITPPLVGMTVLFMAVIIYPALTL